MVAEIERGAVAGFAGALAMSVSTNAEMRLRGRPPSPAPALAIGRLLRIDTGGKRKEMLLTSAGHFVTSVALGATRGAMARLGVRPLPAGFALFGLALLPEVLVLPLLGASPPPWRWSGYDGAIAALHHGVYAGGTNAAYWLLDDRA